jgi:hypothetical protein
MTDRPIIFSAPMVRALLEGRKTQTRRLVRDMPPAPSDDSLVHPARHDSVYFDAYCGGKRSEVNPRGMTENWCWWTRDDRAGHGCRVGYVPGDRLYVREAFRMPDTFDKDSPIKAAKRVDPTHGPNVFYDADGRVRSAGAYTGTAGKLRPSIHMPRWASRLTLTVSDVRVQRLQAISEEDAQAEGVAKLIWDGEGGWYESATGTYRCGFAGIWQHLHGADSWDENPFVVAVSFSVAQGNIDRLKS